MSRRSLMLRVCNALIGASAKFLPGDVREEWESEWRAEVWHRWNQLSTQERLGFFTQLDLLGKTLGAVTHALWLAGRAWRPGTMLQDLRYAVRHLIKRPAFTVIVLASLAFGIGANTLIFSIVDAIILNPYPYPNADRLVVLGASFPQLDLPKSIRHPGGFTVSGARVGTFLRGALLIAGQKVHGKRYGDSRFHEGVEKDLAFGILRSHFHHGYPKGAHCCVQCTLAVYPVLEAGAIRYFDCAELSRDLYRIIQQGEWRFAKPANARMVNWALRLPTS